MNQSFKNEIIKLSGLLLAAPKQTGNQMLTPKQISGLAHRVSPIPTYLEAAKITAKGLPKRKPKNPQFKL
jgi:hypothetical protein